MVGSGSIVSIVSEAREGRTAEVVGMRAVLVARTFFTAEIEVSFFRFLGVPPFSQ